MITAYPIQRAVLGGRAGIQAALFTAGAPVATTLVFTTQPGDAEAGSPFGQQPVVEVRDQFDNPLTTFVGDVTIVKFSGPGTLSGDNVVPVNSGNAPFSDLEFDTAGTYVLRASIASPALHVNSASFEVAAAEVNPVRTNLDWEYWAENVAAGALTAWPDSSGEGHDAAGNGTGVNAVVNGHRVVRMNGTTDLLTGTITAGAAKTVIAVLRKRSNAVSDGIAFQLGTSGSAALVQWPGFTGNNKYVYFGPTTEFVSVPTDWNVVSIVFTDATAAEVFINGVSAGTFNPANDFSTAISVLLAGGPGWTAGDYDFAYHCGYDAAQSPADREESEDSLGTYYNIPITH